MMKLCARLFAVVCFWATATTAFAEGFALYEYSARGIALGGSAVARKPDPSAVAYNPALITRLKGIHLQGGASAITPSGKMKFDDDMPVYGSHDTVSLKSSTWVVPNLYYTHQINDSFTFGVGEFSRFGLGFEYPHDWPGRFNVYEVALTTASVNPNIAWAVTDKLSLAAGLEIMYVTMDLKKRIAPLGNPALLEVDSNIQNADDFGIGGNLAAHYQFNDQWAAGLVYRSQVRIHAKGDVQWSKVRSAGGMADVVYDRTFNDGGADATVRMPDSVAGGVAWTPIPELSLEVGAIWTNWSQFRGLNIHLPDPAGVSYNKKHWDDSWRFNIGAEYDVLDWLTLRAGYVYDQSPMTETYEDYLIPTDGRNIYSAGLGFHWDSWTVDLAFAYIDAKGRKYHNNFDETHVLKSEAKSSCTTIYSLSLGYEF